MHESCIHAFCILIKIVLFKHTGRERGRERQRESMEEDEEKRLKTETGKKEIKRISGRHENN